MTAFVPLAKLNSVERAALLVVCCLPPLYFVLFRGWGLSLWDEGFLWYGAQRVMAGEVPIRDFQAYDVGRYYWSAAVMSLLRDNGIVAMRVSNMVLQIAAVGSWRLTRCFARRHRPGSGMAWRSEFRSFYGRTQTSRWPITWQSPLCSGRWHCFLNDPPYSERLPMGSLWEPWRFSGAITAFTEPSPGWPLFVSRMEAKQYPICPGTRMVLSRNLARLSADAGHPCCRAGPSKPLLGRHQVSLRVWCDEYRATVAAAVVGSVRPATLGHSSGRGTVRRAFPALPAFGALGIGVLCARFFGRHATATPVFASAVFLRGPLLALRVGTGGSPRLALGIFPFLTGIWTLPWTTAAPRTRAVLAGAVCGASLLILLPAHPEFSTAARATWKTITVAGDVLTVGPTTASEIELLTSLAERCGDADRLFLALPFWPGAYAALQQRSPTWEISMGCSGSAEFSKKQRSRVSKPRIPASRSFWTFRWRP